MGGIFSKPKPPRPDPSIADAMRRQQDRLDKQDAELADKEKKAGMALQARRRARRQGGLNLLLSDEREDPELGIQTTLS